MKRLVPALILISLLHSSYGEGQQNPPDSLANPELVRKLDVEVTDLLEMGKYIEAIPLARTLVGLKVDLSDTARARRLRNLGSALTSCGQYDEARPWLEGAVNLLRSTESRDGSELAASLTQLAELLIQKGEFKDAEEKLKEAIDILEHRSIGEDELYGDAIAALGSLRLAKTQYREVQPVLERALAIRRKIGKESAIARSLYGLGVLLEEQGEIQKAQSLTEEAITLVESSLGSEHPILIGPLTTKTWHLIGRHEQEQAQGGIDRQIRLSEEACGKDNALMVPALMQRAELHREAREMSAARADADRAVQIEERSVGDSSPRMAAWLRLQGDILWSVGDSGKAEPVLRRSLELARSQGMEVLAAASMTTLGRLCFFQGRTEEARALFENSQNILDQAQLDGRLSLINLEFIIHIKAQRRGDGTIIALLERAIPLAEKVEGANHLSVAQMKVQLVPLLIANSEIWRAEMEAERALQIFEEKLGPVSADLAAPLMALSSVEKVKGDYGKARNLIDRALSLVRVRFGDAHPATAIVRLSLAEMLASQGDLDEARGIYESAGQVLQSQLGPNHPLVAQAVAGSASIAANSGKYNDALRLFDRAISSLEQNPESGGAYLASTLDAQAQLYLLLRQYAKAEETFARAGQLLGQSVSDPVLRASIEAGRAEAIGEAGRYTDAIPIFKKTISEMELIGVDKTSEFPLVLLGYGNVLLKQSSNEEAAAVYERAFLAIQKTPRPDDSLLGHSLIGRGLAQEARGDLNAARSSYEAALSMWQKKLGPDHPSVSEALQHLGQIEKRQGDLKTAEQSLLHALEIRKAVFGARSVFVGETLLTLGNVRLELGDYKSSHDLVEESLGIMEEALGKGSSALAIPLNTLGLVLQEQGEYSASYEAFERARKLLEDSGASDSREYAVILLNIGNYFLEMGRYSEARPLLERSFSSLSSRLGPDHPDVAKSLQALAGLLALEGDFKGSRRALEQAIGIMERVRSKGGNPELVGRAECALADLLTQQGEYGRARNLKQDCLNTLQKILGPRHPNIGGVLAGLGEMLASQGDIPAALDAYRKALSVTESTLGPGHPVAGLILEKLGSALICKGDVVAARIALEEARRVLEASLGPDHPSVAGVLGLLADIHSGYGDVESAEALISKALEILAAKFGQDDPRLVSMLARLASNRALLHRSSDSTQLLKRAIEIEKLRGPDLGVASVELLCEIGSAQSTTSQHASANESFGQALEILHGVGGESGLQAMGLLVRSGTSSLRERDLKAARSFLESAKQIATKLLGIDDPRLWYIEANLCVVDWEEGKRSSAQSKLLGSVDVFRKETESLLPSLSFAEQRFLLGSLTAYPAPYLLSYFGDDGGLEAAYSRLFPLKGLLIESLRKEAALTRWGSLEPRVATQVERLREVRTDLVGLQATKVTGEDKTSELRRQELSREKEQLERGLVALAPEAHLTDPLRGASYGEVRGLLKADEAIVDIYRYQNLAAEPLVDQYVALVVVPGKDPIRVRLGTIEIVHSTLRYWKNLVLLASTDAKAIADAWRVLAGELWEPLSSVLPAEVRRVWLSPDDELSRVPWQLFPGYESRMNDRLITQVDSVREIVRLKRDQRTSAAARSLLIAGEIDFNAGDGELAMTYSPLPATGEEAREIGKLGLQNGMSVKLLTRAEAQKEEVIRRLPEAEYVHFATHGFFAGNTLAANSPEFFAAFDGLREPWMELVGRTRDPLTESGIALAGANRLPTKSGRYDGVLSAEELIGIDLNKTQLVTLSACETGRGEEETGQGALGLRSAFLAAGARSLIMSLWKVPDAATGSLMEKFYSNLWQRKLPRLEALLEAQRALRDDPSGEYSAPVNWAGWILVGEGW
jgi:tetratricopeptide (TPR) repeat protein/CHAT domain-containing protein